MLSNRVDDDAFMQIHLLKNERIGMDRLDAKGIQRGSREVLEVEGDDELNGRPDRAASVPRSRARGR